MNCNRDNVPLGPIPPNVQKFIDDSKKSEGQCDISNCLCSYWDPEEMTFICLEDACPSKFGNSDLVHGVPWCEARCSGMTSYLYNMWPLSWTPEQPPKPPAPPPPAPPQPVPDKHGSSNAKTIVLAVSTLVIIIIVMVVGFAVTL